MPRKRPVGRQFRGRGLSEHQRAVLLAGVDDFEPGPLIPVAAMTDGEIEQVHVEIERRDFPAGLAATWKRYRSELMADPNLRPGQRPAAFWRLDLQIRPPSNWWEELAMLCEHKLVTPEEALLIERQHNVLSENTAAWGAFDTAEGAHKQHFNPQVFACCQHEFEAAARWHAWRGRPELAEKYAQRAANVQRVLGGEQDATS